MAIDGYYRFPTIFENKVVFVSEDDMWEVPARGGIARRLTANLGVVTHPMFSPDGKLLAFIGREDGESEVYVMPAEGGAATRLTHLGSQTTVLGWTPNGDSILFSSNVGQPFQPVTPVYRISPTGGQPALLPFGPARSISYGPNGSVVIGRRAADLANWKRYRGGTAGDIWIDINATGKFKPLLKKIRGNMAHPLWLGDRIYFLSDHEGIGNIYSCTPAGTDVQRHTHHEDFYARNPSSDGKRIVYRAGAALYIFDPAKVDRKQPQTKIRVKYHSPRVQRNRKFVRAAGHLDHFALHPKGHSLALNTRGKSFAMSNWEGAVIQQGERHSVRYRLTEWLNDGQRLVMVSDASGEETIEVHAYAAQSVNGQHVVRLDGLDIGRPLFLKVSPADDAIVFGNHRYELQYLDLKTKTIKLLDKSNYGRINSADWSPDGRWVVYNFSTSLSTSAIKLCDVETGETHYVTTPHDLSDYGPNFDPAGKYIYFISYRDFDPVGDSHYFDLNFPRGGRPYLVTLQKNLPDPFIPMPDGATSDEDGENGDKINASGRPDRENAPHQEHKGSGQVQAENEEKKPQLKIDLDGIQSRVAVFPVPEGRYYQIKGINKSKVLFTSFPVEGRLGNSWRENQYAVGKGVLELYDLAERKKEFIVNGVNSFNVSRDRNYLIYRSGKNLRVLKAGEKPDNGATGHNKKSGWLNLRRVRVAINPPDEWKQMFREAWRLQRDHFWTEDMSSVDWQLVYERYYPLVEQVASRSEFSDLLWEMQGELGTSHAYELGGDYRPAPRYHQGFLGADFEYDHETDGYRLTHIVQGDPWNEKFNSPLNRLGVNARVGDVLLAIDGQRLSRNVSPQQMLVNRSNIEIQLTLLAPNSSTSRSRHNPADETTQEAQGRQGNTGPESARNVLVKTLHNDRPARYREWVETNRRRVHEQTKGRVGYVHVPDMRAFGYAEFHRYYLAESEREGLIVDVRFNGGGNVSQLLLEKLARRRIGYDKPRYGEVAPYPFHSVLGPMVTLTNEYAGSDGDIFSHAFKILELGPLIGKRTWGGVIGIWPRHSLVDGTFTTQPEFSHWFEDVGWAVENYGTAPDIEVEVKPQDYAKGRDTQLERGIKEILKLMQQNPPRLPDFGPRPSLALPKLPKIKK